MSTTDVLRKGGAMTRPHYKMLYKDAKLEIEILVKRNVELRQVLEKSFFRRLWEWILRLFKGEDRP
jgi:hypothetical protein